MNIQFSFFITLFLVFSPLILVPEHIEAQSGCAQIEAVRVSPSTVAKKQKYTCEVDVTSGSVGSRSIGCGISFDGGYPRNFCPSDITFKGWVGNTAVFECIFPDGNFTAEKVEAVGWDFSCDAADGKRAQITLIHEDSEASGTPKLENVQEQEAEARNLLSDFFETFFGNREGSRDRESGDEDENTLPDDDTQTPSNPPYNGSRPTEPPLSQGSCSGNYTKGACNAQFIVSEIKRADTCGGKVSRATSQCLYKTKINRNTSTIGVQNADQPCPYCYLQCWGIAAMNMHDGLGSPSDLKANALHHNGLNWPTDLAVTATNHVRSLYTIGRFNTDTTNSVQSSLPRCQDILQPGQLFLVIWGFHNAVRPGVQHIAPGYFVDNSKSQIEIHEGNADWFGLVRTRRVTSANTNITYCLVPKTEKFPYL